MNHTNQIRTFLQVHVEDSFEVDCEIEVLLVSVERVVLPCDHNLVILCYQGTTLVPEVDLFQELNVSAT